MTGCVGVWVHQFNKINELTWAEMETRWPGPVYQKVIDGPNWMDEFDEDYRAASHFVPFSSDDVIWTVPTGVQPSLEGEMTQALGAGRVILDLEPYPGFWQQDRNAADKFLASCTRPFDISIDHRRLPGFPFTSFIQRADKILPQVYWTTFQRPWKSVLDEARGAIWGIGAEDRNMEFILPGDADPDDFSDAATWCRDRGIDYSVWVWQNIREENWNYMRADFETDAVVVPITGGCEDQINLLGYLQGDVADAMDAELDTMYINWKRLSVKQLAAHDQLRNLVRLLRES